MSMFVALALVVMPAHASLDIARAYKLKQDLLAVEDALERFHHDLGRYPTTQEGLAALVKPTPELRTAGTYALNGYVGRLPLDPWGHEYQYIAPGTRSHLGYDLWSYGADGKAGGEGVNLDVGNWPGSVDGYIDHIRWSRLLDLLVFGSGFGLVVGIVLGLPIFALRAAYRWKRGGNLRALVRTDLILFPLCVAFSILLMTFVLNAFAG